MSSERNRKPLIIAGIILIILIGIPVLIIWLLQPGKSQWERINSSGAAGPGTAVREIMTDDRTVILTEEWLESRIAEAVTLMNEENSDFQIAGADLSLEENRAGILAGVTLKNPLSSSEKIIRAAVSLSVRVLINESREMEVKFDSLKIGRMPVPVKLLSRIQALHNSVNFENLSKGRNASFNMDTMSFKAPVDDLMNEISPGTRLEELKLSEGELRLALILPAENNLQLREYAAHFGEYSPDLLGSLKRELPSGKTASLDRIQSIIEQLSTDAEEEMLIPLLIEGAALSLEFRDALTPEELEKAEMVFVDFIRENPEVMEETEAFLEAHGWDTSEE